MDHSFPLSFGFVINYLLSFTLEFVVAEEGIVSYSLILSSVPNIALWT